MGVEFVVVLPGLFHCLGAGESVSVDVLFSFFGHEFEEFSFAVEGDFFP